MTEPNLDKQILSLLQHTIDHEDPDRQYIGFLVEMISKIIANQVREARIDELKKWRVSYGQDFHGWPATIVYHLEDDYEARIKELGE